MTEPLTIYECPEPGHGTRLRPWMAGGEPCPRCVPVRVFREEDVRPLWDALNAVRMADDHRNVGCALNAFPAPEAWTT
jgi:hypothetical protein